MYKLETSKLIPDEELDEGKENVCIVACGSFNPITNGHLMMLEMGKDYLKNQKNMNVVGGFISPVHENYKKKGLIESKYRYEMVKMAIEESEWLSVDDWEITRDDYTRTVYVLEHFKEELKQHYNKKVRILFLCGADLLKTFIKPNVWLEEHINAILGTHGVVVFERKGVDLEELIEENEILKKHKENIHIVPQLIENDISSTKIRDFIAMGYTCEYLTPTRVLKYARDNQLYVKVSNNVI